MSKISRQVAHELTKAASDNGRLIEIGWVAMLLHVIPDSAQETQITEMRKAFFMGAEHLFNSIMTVLDPEGEPTEADMHRMSMIATELDAFRKQVTQHAAPERRQ